MLEEVRAIFVFLENGCKVTADMVVLPYASAKLCLFPTQEKPECLC